MFIFCAFVRAIPVADIRFQLLDKDEFIFFAVSLLRCLKIKSHKLISQPRRLSTVKQFTDRNWLFFFSQRVPVGRCLRFHELIWGLIFFVCSVYLLYCTCNQLLTACLVFFGLLFVSIESLRLLNKFTNSSFGINIKALEFRDRIFSVPRLSER